jgi:hypothetical protein
MSDKDQHQETREATPYRKWLDGSRKKSAVAVAQRVGEGFVAVILDAETMQLDDIVAGGAKEYDNFAAAFVTPHGSPARRAIVSVSSFEDPINPVADIVWGGGGKGPGGGPGPGPKKPPPPTIARLTAVAALLMAPMLDAREPQR